MKKILLIITGSIAAPKALNLIKILKKNYQVDVILTPNASKFVKMPTTIKFQQKFLEKKFYDLNSEVKHVSYNYQHNLLVVYPATMNFISKFALAIPDNLALATILTSNNPKIIFPAMNQNMYQNPSLQKHLIELTKISLNIIIEPKIGYLAEKINGERLLGIGRLPEPEEAKKIIDDFFQEQNLLKNKTILINYGSSRSYLDPVRFLTSESSGKMGQALVNSCLKFGATVIAIVGDINQPLITHENLIIVRGFTNQEVLKAMKIYYDKADLVISAASLSDFEIINPNSKKIEKIEQTNLTIKLKNNIDILSELTKTKKQQIVIAFSAQEKLDEKIARKKMEAKKCDGIIINQYHVANQDETKIIFIFKDKKYYLQGLKTTVAHEIIKIISPTII